MLRKDLRSIAGTVSSGELFFSASNCNGLFSYNLNDMSVKFIKLFDRENDEKIVIHRECCVCGNWIVFIPQIGGFIDFYNIESGENKRIQVTEKETVKAFASVESFMNKVYVLPLDKSKSPLIVDMDTFEVTENKTILSFIKENSLMDELTMDFVFTRSFIKDGVIYAGLYKTNMYMSYNILKNECKIHRSSIDDIFGVQQGNSGIWVLGLSGEIEFIGEDNRSVKYNTKVEGLLPRQWAYNRLLDVNGVGIAIPAYANSIIKLSNGNVDIIQYPKKFEKEINDEWIKFYGGTVYENKVYLYPYTYGHLLVIENDLIEAVPIEFDSSNALLNEKDINFFKEDMRQMARNYYGVLLENEAQYDIYDLLKIL